MNAVRSVILFLGFMFCGDVVFAETFSQKLCRETDRYDCYAVKKKDSWERLYPDREKRDFVMRVNRMNTHLYPGIKIAIPKNLEPSTKLDYSPFPKTIEPPKTRTIMISTHPNVLAWAAYDTDGTLQGWGPVSGGQQWCRDIGHSCRSKVGEFDIYRKQGSDCRSSKFPIGRGGAPMPYCMFFSGGYALHGSYEVPGYNASHGCIRLFIPDAKWLNEEFHEGNKVHVIITNREI